MTPLYVTESRRRHEKLSTQTASSVVKEDIMLITEEWPGWAGLGGLVEYQDGVHNCVR